MDSNITNFVNHWIGKPYKFGGTTEKGIDCSAFAQKFYREVLGVEIPRTCYYQYQFLDKIPLGDLIVGDIIFFTSKVSPSGWHVGIYLGNDLFVHSSNYRDKVKISCLLDEKYLRIFKSGGRLKKN